MSTRNRLTDVADIDPDDPSTWQNIELPKAPAQAVQNGVQIVPAPPAVKERGKSWHSRESEMARAEVAARRELARLDLQIKAKRSLINFYRLEKKSDKILQLHSELADLLARQEWTQQVHREAAAYSSEPTTKKVHLK